VVELIKVKNSKVHHGTDHEGLEGEWSMIPRERDPIPTVQEAGWASGPVWRGVKNLAPIRT